jgi:hypothetical protein
MANSIEITKDFPATRERSVLLELLRIMRTLRNEGIDALICGGWVPFLKELATFRRKSEAARADGC